MGKTARILLKNKWLKAGLSTVVILLMLLSSFSIQIFFLPNEWALFFSIVVSLFIIKPTMLGYKRWCAKLSPNEKARLKELFYFFKTPKRYLKSVLIGLAVSLRVLLKAIMSMVFPALFFGVAQWLRTQPQTEITEIFAKNCIFLGLTASTIFLILFIMSTAKNVAISYFIAADETIKLKDAVRLSSGFMKEKSKELLKTFFLILPPCLLIIPAFFIVPYFVTVFSQYIKNFKQEITFACV